MDPNSPQHSNPADSAERSDKSVAPRQFVTTSWSMVVKAGDEHSPDSREALEVLCKHYWYPIYAFLRRKGLGSHDAEELTQAFFAHLLERNRLATADPLRGRFRTFLLTSLNHFMIQDWRKRTALKRGGDVDTLQIDFEDANQRYSREPVDCLTPEKLFDRKWAIHILQQVLDELESYYRKRDRLELFNALKPRLTFADAAPLGDVAAQLGFNEITVKVAAHRMREKYRQTLEKIISMTVEDPQDVKQEINDLFQSLSGV